MPNDLPATAMVNEAIARFLGLWWDEQRADAIKEQYGFATCTAVHEVYRFAVDYPVDWSTITYDQALEEVRIALQQAYPFLTDDGIVKLSACFAYLWK